jgi:hypothetical protein
MRLPTPSPLPRHERFYWKKWKVLLKEVKGFTERSERFYWKKWKVLLKEMKGFTERSARFYWKKWKVLLKPTTEILFRTCDSGGGGSVEVKLLLSLMSYSQRHHGVYGNEGV